MTMEMVTNIDDSHSPDNSKSFLKEITEENSEGNITDKRNITKNLTDIEPNVDAAVNPAADLRKMRRIIAEDPEWSLAIVPLLVDIVTKHIIDNFQNNSSILNYLPDKFRTKVLLKISTDLPLKIIVHLINEEEYWKRRCQATWQVCDIASYENSWKQMYCEKNLQKIIENFIPNKTDTKELFEVLSLSSNYIHRLKIRQLLPPIKDVARGTVDDNVSEVDESEVSDEPKIDHFDFNNVMPNLKNLTEFKVSYGVADCGMNFEWNLFNFTARDCLLLAKCIASCEHLKVFALNRSNVDDDKIRVIISHILDHPGLIDLDISHNVISDRGARAIGKFINNHSKLVKLNICDNNIKSAGGQAIAHALSKNTTLKELNIRLNCLGNEGGQAICKAMMKNNMLTNLNIAANELSESTIEVLSQVLMQNTSLENINLSSNRIDSDGGKLLQEGLDKNETVTEMDLRITECDQESIYSIGQILNRNRSRKKKVRMNENVSLRTLSIV